MRHFRKGLARAALLCLALTIMEAAAPPAQPEDTDTFKTITSKAIANMHTAMHVPFTGDTDRDFARMMIPHHQGAIDMALAELRYGKDERLKRLAQEIIVEQQQEITVMRQVLSGEAR